MVAVPLEFDGSEGSDNLAPFGIGTEEGFRLALRRSGAGFDEMLIGKGIPLDVGYVYAWLPGEKSLYKVQREVREFLDRTLFEMRNKRLTFLTPEEIGEAVIESGGRRIQLERIGGWWEITRPLKAPADGNAVEALLEGLTALRATDFPESPLRAKAPVRRLTLRGGMENQRP